ncbi:MAG: hypothetical protein HC900_00280 [Methylacidiphilales bacterium]|nr:hypothetical protein [Candidatus Methylacidiphilales bacterium]
MPRVPEYQDVVRSPALEPGGSFRDDARASSSAFGAGIGQGMQDVARGGMDFAGAAQRVQELDDVNAAKEADNRFAEFVRNRMYGENGFMGMSGRNAVDGQKEFLDDVTAARREYAQGLPPQAQRHYMAASQSRLDAAEQSGRTHAMGQRKVWFNSASTARVETFASDALSAAGDPGAVEKNVAAGIMELRERGAMLGWDAATLRKEEVEFASGVHRNVTLRIAQSDPMKADEYRKANAKFLTGKDAYDLESHLQKAVLEEQSRRTADDILSQSRTVGQADAAAIKAADVGRPGPTRDRAFLISRLTDGKDPSHVTGLDGAFATNLTAMIQDAPPDIRDGLRISSGFRDAARQAGIVGENMGKYGFGASDRAAWRADVAALGPEAAGAKWGDRLRSAGLTKMVALPGRSHHQSGQAVDLTWNGQRLDAAPQSVRDYVQANASKYGLVTPMSWEPWHVEPASRGAGRLSARSDTVTPRSQMPSYEDIERRLMDIQDPRLRDLTRQRLGAMMEMRVKAAEQNERAAKAELWRYIDQGATPDDVPFEVRQAAGMAAVGSAWDYAKRMNERRDVESDQVLLYDMRRFAAMKPEEFSRVDLNDYRDRLSKKDVEEMTRSQTSALTDMRKAKADGANLTSAFNQADAQLEAVGLKKSPSKMGDDDRKRIAEFQNALAMEMQAFQQANSRTPTQIEAQQIINKLLMPIVIREPRSAMNPLGWFGSSTSNTSGRFLFEAGKRPDGSTVDFDMKASDVPINLRSGIALDLERELGRKPSEAEIVKRYVDFRLGR